jgi:hypothetical protein
MRDAIEATEDSKTAVEGFKDAVTAMYIYFYHITSSCQNVQIIGSAGHSSL